MRRAPRITSCACGCSRKMLSNAPWDGYHGPASPLEDPRYVPEHPPVNGGIPDVVAKWGARSQLRWFHRHRDQIKPQSHARWSLFYVHSEAHRGLCCDSCMDDRMNGYGDDIDTCCCVALREVLET